MTTYILPEGWKRPPGWSHGAVAGSGRTLAVAGQFGWDPQTFEFIEGFVTQWDAALRNVVAVVEAAGGKATDVISLQVLVTDLASYNESRRELGPGWAAAFGSHFPAITLYQVSGLIEPKALIEIEALAVIAQ